MKIRDRIKEFRRVKASDLAPNPKNWRTHPKGQKDALRGILQLGRKCYGMEISPAYCDVIVKRWETLTGKKAALESKNNATI